MIVACYRPLPLSACMLHFDLVSILFGTSIPTSFNILVKMFLHLLLVKSFTELGPQLLAYADVEYLLSEVFSQDPLERYFSKQRHRGGSNENPTAAQVPLNGMTIVQQQSIYKDIKTMNIEQDCSPGCNNMYTQPLPKRRRQQGVQL